MQKSFINPKYTNLEVEDSFFINFNYTDTLEVLYKIPEDKVLHIHGRASRGEKLIFGHSMHLFGDEKSGYEGQKVSEVLNQYEKNPYMHIPEYLQDRICHVKNVHILGFSFSIVDTPYIEWILENTCNNCEWEISWHSMEDKLRIEKFILDNPSLINRNKLIQIKEVE